MNPYIIPGLPRYASNTDYVLKKIRHAITDTTGYGWNEIKAGCRERELVIARHLFFYFAKKLTPYSLKSVGAMLGGRDHTTVIHGINKIEKGLAINDWAIVGWYKKIEVMLKQTIAFPITKPKIIRVDKYKKEQAKLVRPKAEYSNKSFQ